MDEAWGVHAVIIEGFGPVMFLGLSLRWGIWFWLRSAGK
jgi:hypothetical protein